MVLLDNTDVRLFNMSFNVFNVQQNYMELTGRTGQQWCVYMEDDDIVVLLHRHFEKDKYHVHYLCRTTTEALSEILQHERYIEKRKKIHQQICGNRKIEIVL